MGLAGSKEVKMTERSGLVSNVEERQIETNKLKHIRVAKNSRK